MLKVILIDDDELSLQFLQHALYAHSAQVEVVGAYTGIFEAVEAVRRMPVDLVMLDIEMPAVNGLDLARELMRQRENLSLVFVTAHPQYALDAFRANAIDYIMKPCTADDIGRVLAKAIGRQRLIYADVPQSLIDAQPNRVRTAGSLAVLAAGRREPVRLTETIAELFAYLVCHREVRISKWVLCDLFWADQEPEQAMHSLYTAVYRLKRMLRDSGFPFNLISHHGFYQVALTDCQVDYECVHRLAAYDGPITKALAAEFESVISTYSSGFLEVHDFAWSRTFAERIEADYRTIGLRYMLYLRELRLFRDASALGGRLERRFPYDDDVQTAILQVLADQEDTQQVKAQYERYRRRLQQEQGSSPTVRFVRSYFQMLGQ